jgi:hypothetical protein
VVPAIKQGRGGRRKTHQCCERPAPRHGAAAPGDARLERSWRLPTQRVRAARCAHCSCVPSRFDGESNRCWCDVASEETLGDDIVGCAWLDEATCTGRDVELG